MQNPMMFTYPKKVFARSGSECRPGIATGCRALAVRAQRGRRRRRKKVVVVKTDKGSCRSSSHIGNVGSHNAHVNSHNGNVILFR
jgi:hypothetical protein